eukprot:12622022-Heterocapsa_arctica.AAC.1
MVVAFVSLDQTIYNFEDINGYTVFPYMLEMNVSLACQLGFKQQHDVSPRRDNTCQSLRVKQS